MGIINGDIGMAAAKKFLNKAEILAKDDLKTEDVFVPEWDAWVKVRSLNASERDHFEASTVQRNGKRVTTNLENIRARLCLLCMVDEDGNRLFDEGDTFPLGGKSASALDRIFTVAQKLNGLRDEDVDELAKNSSAGQSEDSASD
jgi:hypothetical protein